MLGFCSNAGPAFIFGISGALFNSALVPAVLYIILILSSVLTGILLPGGTNNRCLLSNKPAGNPLNNALHAIITVCGWVVLFRILLTFLQKWILWIFPQSIIHLFSGLLELTNGCIGLNQINDMGLRFITLCVIMSFGGFCVAMQTFSVIGQLSCKYYLIGKIIQSYLSFCLALVAVRLLFPGNIPSYYIIIAWVILPAVLFIRKFKNYTGNYRVHSV